MKRMFFCFLFFTFSTLAGDVVQGPFKIPGGDKVILVKKNQNIINGESYPYLNLDIVNGDGSTYTLDKYDHEGGEPKIESVFFVKSEKEFSIYTIVSWFYLHRAEKINATYYQVFSYDVDMSGIYRINTKVSNDKKLRGFDGEVQGENVIFRYSTADEVKKYIKYN